MQLKSGTFLQGGKYRIEKMLGQGGFGITYLAYEPSLERYVAIKEFFMKDVCNREADTSHVSVPSLGSREIVARFRAKFVKEAQSIAKLKHANIVSIYSTFEENDTAYYVMEYHKRGSLGDMVKQRGPLSESNALHFIRKVADALAYLHGRQMNHLDIKPDNILIDENGNPVLIDFGMSKHYDVGGKETSTTPIGISHGYAPMEQYKKGGVNSFSPATDIYSLGATLYKLLTGITPPEANDIFENAGLFKLPKSISPLVGNAIMQAMQSRRAERPQSIADFLALIPANENNVTMLDDIEIEVIDAGPGKKVDDVKKKARKNESKSQKNVITYRWLTAFFFGALEMAYAYEMKCQSVGDWVFPRMDADGAMLAYIFPSAAAVVLIYLAIRKYFIKAWRWKVIRWVTTILFFANTSLLVHWNRGVVGAYFLLSCGLALISLYTILIKPTIAVR